MYITFVVADMVSTIMSTLLDGQLLEQATARKHKYSHTPVLKNQEKGEPPWVGKLRFYQQPKAMSGSISYDGAG